MNPLIQQRTLQYVRYENKKLTMRKKLQTPPGSLWNLSFGKMFLYFYVYTYYWVVNFSSILTKICEIRDDIKNISQLVWLGHRVTEETAGSL